MNSYLILIFLFGFINLIEGRLFVDGSLPDWKMMGNGKSSGNRLLLTPLIEGGDDMKARKLSVVDKKYFMNVTSYSGFITVNPEYNSNLWFWFFPAEGTTHLYESDIPEEHLNDDEYNYEYYDDDNVERRKGNYSSTSNKTNSTNNIDWENEGKPLILWLQGGPGSSSLFGLFTEIGPFFIDDDDEISLRENKFSWHKNYSLLFVDNPVGCGFSFSNDYEGYASEMKQVGREMYIFLIQFFKLFPWLKHVEFYIAGESFAGKYLPAVGYEIFMKNNDTNSEFKINLQGLAIGNGFTDPPNMLDYSKYVYQLGLVDDHGRREMELFELFAHENIFQPQSKIFWDLILGTFSKYSYYTNVYNFLKPRELVTEPYLKFIDQPHIRKAIHVGSEEFSSPQLVYYNFVNDFMVSAMPEVDKLLDNGLRIMFYSGNLDIIVPYPLSVNAFNHMHWTNVNKYKDSFRYPFAMNETLVGYIKKFENFADVMILNAGHMVPTDQPQVAFELISRFINNKL